MAQLTEALVQDILNGAGCTRNEIEQLCHAWLLATPQSSAPVVGEHVRRLVGKLAQWQHCMSYNESYFGEPAGLVKQVTAELAHAIDPIYPPMTTPVDPLAGVTIYTSESALTGRGTK